MSYLRFLARRGAFALISTYAVVTVMFVLVDQLVEQELAGILAEARYYGASPEEVQEIRASFLSERGLQESLLQRYLDWLVDVVTLDWGYSFAYDQSVIAVVDGRVPTTLEYVLPGVLLAVVLGVALGLFAALDKDGLLDRSARVTTYALLGVPAFMLLIYYARASEVGLGSAFGVPLLAPVLHPQVLAALTVASSLLAGQVRFSRTAAIERTGQSFVKMLRAKGVSRLRLARHVLRNASLPIVSLSVSELLAVLMLDIYVIETVLPIDGLAIASLRAVRASDIPLVIWTTMVLVVLGITGNFLQDVLYGYLDPRVRVD
ncbi:ABC transporter permease [Haloglomus litoreum]|uniref:ABC transporter permease n=1 Tax=Haloglomus litoreum TaxID=3034026 RepID=UPI0023E8B991|nr:ABC transporter permease [Haloglomus sp. DT116]